MPKAEHGDIHWTELMAWDTDTARAFYGATAGWTFVDNPMGPELPYILAMKGGAPVAGLMQMTKPEFEGVPSHWMTYIAVDDIDQTVEAAKAAGATIKSGPFDVPNVGRIAMIQDPGGAVIGMMTPAPPPGE